MSIRQKKSGVKVKTVAENKPRRTQAERSAKMQETILSATLKCIGKQGLQNASTHEVCREAGISRGALLHHYPSRYELLKAAFGKVLDDEVENLSDFSKNLKQDGTSIRSTVEYIWTRYKGLLFMVTVDYLSQARVDDETLKAVTIEATRFNAKLNDVWDMSLSEVNVTADRRRSYMNQTQCLIRGMALQRIWRKDEIYFDTMLSEWVDFLELQFKK